MVRSASLGWSASGWSKSEHLRQCATQAELRPHEIRYRDWLFCVTRIFRSSPTLPIGRFRRPDVDTLVLFEYDTSGGACLNARTYDLASGSTFLTDHCHKLARPGDPYPRPPGRIHPDGNSFGLGARSDLSRALWILFSRQHMEHGIRVHADRVLVPKGMVLGWRRGVESQALVHHGFGIAAGEISHYRVL